MKDKDKDGMAKGGKVSGKAPAMQTEKVMGKIEDKVKGKKTFEHFAKGGPVKCKTGGMIVRGMGCATKGGNYKGMK